MNHFGKTLKKLRVDRNISAIKLSEDLNIHRGTLSNWETGKRTPDTEMLLKISDYFGVTVDFLLGNFDSSNYQQSIQGLKELSGFDNVFNVINKQLEIIKQPDLDIGKFSENTKDFLEKKENLLEEQKKRSEDEKEIEIKKEREKVLELFSGLSPTNQEIIMNLISQLQEDKETKQ